jgi:hypothetical protein
VETLSKSPKSDLFEPCGNFLKSGKACPKRKLKGRAMCRRCLDRKRLMEDPEYRHKRASARKRRMAKCPKCNGEMAYSSAVCQDCRTGGARTWEEVAALYSYRNPKDPLTGPEAKRIGDAAMQKMRRLIENPNESFLSDALLSLKDDAYG